MWAYLALGFVAGMGAGAAVFMWLIARLIADISTVAQHITRMAELSEITRAE